MESLRLKNGAIELHQAGQTADAIDFKTKPDRLLGSYLETSPYIERRECHVSKEYAWLLSPATHVVERLVKARSTVVFGLSAQSIMLMVPALRFWRDADFSEHKGDLNGLVPKWPDLNDALYWASIEQARALKAAESSEPLNNDWSVSWLGHFWTFDTTSLPRLFDYMRSRSLQDDRLVALSTAFRVFVQAERPAYILKHLKKAVVNDPVLQNQLHILLNPPVSKTMQRFEKEEAKRLRKMADEKQREKQARDSWIAELRATPERVHNPPKLKGVFTDDQYWLMHELQDRSSVKGRSEYAEWKSLAPDFGETVALAYRDAAVNHWRHYFPTLQSEGVKRDNSTPYELMFAMAGLEIEAAETADFPLNLNESEICHALRYITWELTGFPRWLERIHQVSPNLVESAVMKELLWELENTGPDEQMHYILQDLVYNAPWLHTSMVPVILQWMEANSQSIKANRHYCLHILINCGTDPARLAALASRQIAQANNPDSHPWWFALRVDCEPTVGIPEVQQWLAGLEEGMAIPAAQAFVTALMGGGRHLHDRGPLVGNFRTPEHLKSLYLLMHRYIRPKDDIERAGKGAYSPTLRDDAQDARNRLFTLLSEFPGKASYMFIKQLIDEHPEPQYRPWMARQAYKRAEIDGDVEPWTAEQVCAFNATQTIIPATHRQLFDLAVHRLLDLKNWLESGNDSPWQTWRRADGETEMRTLVAGWLNQQCRNQYTTAQEPELANSQRMDIWLHNTNVRSPVPIELKLLDKGWSGPKLCERLRNQLVGDYLREESAGCGVMLLVWQGKKPEKQWTINGRRVGLNELTSALKLYWQSVSNEFPGVEAINVVVIDLTVRAQVSNS